MPKRFFFFGLVALFMTGAHSGCEIDQQTMTEHAHTNRLAKESSPYLLQHAHNPVEWYPWGEEALEKAKAENKLLLISVGYSSCHWCHVMERESFEDSTVAALMNEKFVAIKVDREERPDIDQIYMNAVQLMTGRGGWPLNCFALPDGRPVYGGTYYPKEQWMQVLNDLATTHEMEPAKVVEYAEKLTAGVQQSELVKLKSEPAEFSKDNLDALTSKWKESFDNKHGGPDRAPKFPIPNNYEFLLHQALLTGDSSLEDHVLLTLDKMALGGIYDHIGGGFARYSTDILWKVPHFEKMLYDNAQLVSLYSKAYQHTGKLLYKDVVEETVSWLEREMTSKEGAFYSAIDADSEGEEGRYYVWKKEELDSLLGDDMKIAKRFYSVNAKGHWEHGNYILLRDMDDEQFAADQEISLDALRNTKERIKQKLLAARETRERPGTDDKSLTSWNAMMVSGLCHAYSAFGDEKYLQMAERNTSLFLSKCARDDGGLFHNYKDGKASINGYLEDYAAITQALLDLYQVTFDEEHLNKAEQLTEYVRTHFHDESSGMFFFTSDLDPALIARKMEITDNVIPASNSTMARSLFLLGHLKYDTTLLSMAEQMLNNIAEDMINYPAGYSNWGLLMQGHTHSFHEVAITGQDALDKRQEFGKHYLPNTLFLGGKSNSKLPLLEGKFLGETTIFVCQNRSCQLPVNTVSEALKQFK